MILMMMKTRKSRKMILIFKGGVEISSSGVDSSENSSLYLKLVFFF